MDRRIFKGIIAVILIAVVNVAVFLLGSEFETNFWISYAFAMLAAIVTTLIEIFYVHKEKLIFRYPLSAITYVYLVIALVAAFLLTKLLEDHVTLLFVIHLFILAFYVVVFLFGNMYNSAIKGQQQTRGVAIQNFKYILESMNAIISTMTYGDPNRKTVQHAYDSLASGQVKSDPSVMDVEQRILNLIDSLRAAVSAQNNEQITACCQQLELAAEERKRIFRQRSTF